MGALSRLQKQVREVLSPYDLMIVLGADPLRMSVYSEVDPLPDGHADRAGRPGRLGSRQELRRRNRRSRPMSRKRLRALIPALKAAGGAALETRAKKGIAALAAKNWTRAAREVDRADSKQSSHASPIDPDWLALQLVEAMPDNAILVDEGLTSSRQITALRPHRDRYGYHALASGGIGWGIAGLGRRQPRQSRPAGGVLLRRRQRDVFDPGAVDRGASQAAADAS